MVFGSIARSASELVVAFLGFVAWRAAAVAANVKPQGLYLTVSSIYCDSARVQTKRLRTAKDRRRSGKIWRDVHVLQVQLTATLQYSTRSSVEVGFHLLLSNSEKNLQCSLHLLLSWMPNWPSS